MKIYPATSFQRRLWVEWNLVPENPAYNNTFSFHMKGTLNTQALENSLRFLTEKYTAYRTYFHEAPDSLEQVIVPFVETQLHYLDLTQFDSQNVETARTDFLNNIYYTPFNLCQPPLFRYGLIKLNDTEHILAITWHHIINDGTAMYFSFETISESYNLYVADESPIVGLEAYDMEKLLKKEDSEQLSRQADLVYWRQRLHGAAYNINLSNISVASLQNISPSIRIRHTLSRELTAKIATLVSATHTTLFIILAAAFNALLYRYTHQQDLVVGYLLNAREKAASDYVGFCINTLLLRTQLQGTMTFLELVSAVSLSRKQDKPYQNMPYDELLHTMRQVDNQMIDKLCNILISQTTMTTVFLNLNNIKTTTQVVTHNFAKYDLSLLFDLHDEMLALEFEYNTDKFDTWFIEQFIESFHLLLEEVAHTPSKPLAELNILSQDKLSQISTSWNNTTLPLPLDSCLHTFFEERVKKHPENIAVVFDKQQLTYRELNDKANQLAYYLRGCGVQEEALVAISVERSLEMIIGLLGILKAGGAYVPVDPNYPFERIQYILEDTQAALLLTQDHLVEKFINHRCKVIGLEIFGQQPSSFSYSVENPKFPTKSTHLAYVIYTSGSTGQPKGVAIEHRSVVNRLLWMQSQYQLTTQDKVLQKTPFNFDVSVWEFFWPLQVGAQLVIALPESHQDPKLIQEAIQLHGISVIHFVPSMLQVFLTDNPEKCTSLRLIFTSGEALSYDGMRHCLRVLPTARLHNLYGPTEAAVDVSYWDCSNFQDKKIVPIGKPIANIQLYVLDPFKKLVPIGVTGELHIAGVGVARGYLNKPDLTADRFIPNPFAIEETDTKLYCTGDLVRYLNDGNIEYLGRIDHQIKMRGFRIELGEIEFYLRQHPQVQDGVVIASEEGSSQHLIAYIVPQNSTVLAGNLVESLIQFLTQQLPNYMVPSIFVLLEKLPLNANGKLDRKALPAPDTYHRSNTDIFVAPQREIERTLATLWSELLKLPLEQISIKDNFFYLGGHSLLATRLRTAISHIFKLELPLKAIFDSPTIDDLAKRIDNEKEISMSQTTVITPQLRPRDIPLSFSQERLWFIDQLLPNNNIYNIPVAMSLIGALNVSALKQAFQGLLARHEVLRTQFVDHEGIAVQIIIPQCQFDLRQLNVGTVAENKSTEAALQLCEEEVLRPFDLSKAPLIRGLLVTLSADKYILLICMHHVVSDGWSIEIMLKELSEFYNHYVLQKPLTLESLPIQYADFSLWQKNWLQGEILAQQLQYWRKQLANVPQASYLPIDKNRPGNPSYHGGNVTKHIEVSLSKELKCLGDANHASLFMVMLAALNVLFYRYSEQKTIVIGSPIANRHYSGVENLVGFFANTLALKCELNDDLTFAELLTQIRAMTLDAYAHQDIPYEQLVDQVHIPWRVKQQPLFQAMLIIQNNEQSVLSVEGLKSEPLAIHYPVARFDLSIFATELADKRIRLEWIYATDLFDEATIVRMAHHFETLLSGIVNNMHEKITHLPWITETERRRLLAWNQTETVYPADKLIHQLFEEQVDRTPNKPAIRFGEQVLNYIELNKKSNQLAHYLRSLGVKQNTLIAICFDRSLEMIIAILGILKAGGTYVPMDPKYPQTRLEYFLKDTKSPFLLTTEHVLTQLPWLQKYKTEVEMLNTDNFSIMTWESFFSRNNEYDTNNPVTLTSSNPLAYLIYTSGSTGKPKGVCGTHSGMVNRLAWSWQALPFTHNEVCCQKTSLNFVDHVAEIFSPLLQGVPLVLLSSRAVDNADILQMIEDIAQNHITRITVVPSLLKAILDQDRAELIKLTSLKYVFCSGEALPLLLAQRFYEVIPNASLVNIYGSSEVSADVTYYRLPRGVQTYFREGLEQVKAVLPIAKDDLITTPFVELETLQKQFMDSKMPVTPIDYQQYRQALLERVFPYIVNTASPNFIGHMTSVLPSFTHDFSKLISVLNQNVVKIETSKSLTFLEREVVAMLHRSFYDYDDQFYEHHIQTAMSNLGVVVSNGSLANLTALWVARNGCFPADGVFTGIAEEGFGAALTHYGCQASVILASPLLHYSFEKTASVLGVGKKHITHLQLTSDNRVDIQALRAQIVRCKNENKTILALVAIAGATETGSIDPLSEMAAIAREFDIHFHVDAAFGGPVIFSKQHKYVLQGIEYADSITLCGHKQLYLPMGISVCLFKDPKKARSIYNIADYQATLESFDFGKSSLEGSRAGVSLGLHAAVHLIGKEGYAELITKGIESAQYLKQCILKNEAFELILDPCINIVNYRYIPKKYREKVKNATLSAEENIAIDDANMLLQTQQFKEGQTFVSKTHIPTNRYPLGVQTLRVVLTNPLTTAENIHLVLQDQLNIAARYIEHEHMPAPLVIPTICSGAAEHVTVTIGKPIANTQVYILDRHLQLLPIGVAGELYIGGVNLSPGYFNQSELTIEKFIHHPFKPNSGEKLFKTGDLCRLLENGDIEYLGRLDQQVKIRGIRIELGEIAYTLQQHVQVQDAVVLVKEPVAQQKILMAFVVAKNRMTQGALAREFIVELKRHLAEQLPDYMVPQQFMLLEGLPLNPNGKIDRNALLSIDTDDSRNLDKFVSAENAIQQKLIAVWAEVLNIETSQISLNDSFLALGGHSLLATRLQSKLNQAFKIKIDLRTIFDKPTVRELANFIQKLEVADLTTNIAALKQSQLNEIHLEEDVLDELLV